MRLIDGGAGRRGDTGLPPGDASPPAAAPPAVSVVPPADLQPLELALWQAWAPLAEREGTLTDATLVAFQHVMQLQIEIMKIDVELGDRLPPGAEPRPLLAMSAKHELALKRLRLMLRKELAPRLKDFKLAPFGKELTPAGGAGGREVDPLDAFTRG